MHWFYDPDFRQSTSTIGKSELIHFKSLRIRAQQEIVVTDGKGMAYTCEVLDPKSGELRVISSIEKQRPALQIHLIQALAKGDRDEQAVQASVELGVTSITPWQSDLSIVNWAGKEDKGRNRWQEIAISAIKQSQQAFLPTVFPVQNTSRLKSSGFGLVLDPRASTSFGQIPESLDEFTIVVGPEGGIPVSELEQLKGAGFEPIKMGDSVLRTSTAGPAAIAAIFTKLHIW